MAKRRARKKKAGCTVVTFKRAKRGGKLLPKSKWKKVLFCR